MSYYESKLSLLTTISQSRVGAVHVMNCGIFPAVRASGLFSVDPDIGIGEFCKKKVSRIKLTCLEIDSPEALGKYYRLLLSLTRVIATIVLSRGPQNEQTIDSAREFLVENRPLVVSIFKRQARIGGVTFDNEGVDIEDLVELLVLLIAMTNFLDVSQSHQFPFSRLTTCLVRRTTRYPEVTKDRLRIIRCYIIKVMSMYKPLFPNSNS